MSDGMAAPGGAHGASMDAQYRLQRHVYDLTRKYYLLGRDGLVRALAIPAGGSVLEIGCGTGRNLALVRRSYPSARLFGIDISTEMLKNARRNVPGARFAQADATDFDPASLLGEANFDRLFMSYTLSMIPDWQAALDQAARLLAPGGQLHIVDFGQQERLPGWFRALLQGWLRKFHVAPRSDLFTACETVAARYGLRCTGARLFRGYAWSATLTKA